MDRAHDFNNLLVGILGNAELALDSRGSETSLRESLDGIVTAGRRAAELCRQMLAYAGRASYLAESIDLREVVDEMESLLVVPDRVSFEHRFADSLPRVRADAAQVRQVVMNLIVNAADAIGDREGSITVRIDTQWCEPSFFESTYLGVALAAGPYVVLEVSDTGCGMDRATLARMFDPFFSTKSSGRGLGLAAVLGIVGAHAGAISVESRVGHGTCARVYLPASDDASSADDALDPLRDWQTSGVALVIDDEPGVRAVAQGMLERAGFKVLATASGEDGIDALRAHGAEVRVVVLDLVMPGLGGAETLRRLRAVRPDLRVLIMSGSGEAKAIEQLAGSMADAYLQKPFTRSEFTRAVRATLRA